MREYVVRYGDTLSGIAAKALGRASRWPELGRFNHIENPNAIFVGQRLRLPDTLPGAWGASTLPGPRDVTAETGGQTQFPAHLALARGFMFIVFEQLPEIGVGKIIRKVAAVPRDFSLRPANLLGKLSPAEHTLNLNPTQSQFLSASDRSFGAPSINGKPLILDVAKIQQAGGRIYSVAEVVKDLERFAAQNPAAKNAIAKLISTIRDIEGEVLIKGEIPPGVVSSPGRVHSAFIRSAEDLWAEFRANRMTRIQLNQELAGLEAGYSRARILGNAGRVLTVVAVVVTAVDMAQAAQRSIDQGSARPLAAETLRQVGGWGGAYAGAQIGAVAGAAFGIETGPGLVLTGIVGAIVFGAAGYFGADWIADMTSPN